MSSDQGHGAEIIPFPDFEKLRAEVERLRAELSMLVLEHDELLYVECRNIETAYMLELGGLEYKVYELECALLRLKRKMELIQAKLNRQEKIVLADIEARLDAEFAEYQEKLDAHMAKMNEALEHSNGRPLTKEEVRELKQLYRAIVKALHPDLNPGLSEAKIQLFHHAVEAYKNGDLVRLRMISFMIEDPVLPNEKTDVYKQLQEEKKRLTEALSNVREKIAEIKSAFPYTMKSFLQNPERVAARKAELNAAIQQLKEWQAYYTDRIQHMLR